MRNRNGVMLALVCITLLTHGCSEVPNDENSRSESKIDSTEEATPEQLSIPADPFFVDVAESTGLVHRHFSGATGDYRFAEILAPGGALFDYDNDGDLDVYLVQSNMLDPTKSMDEALFPPPPDQPVGNRLFRNDLIPGGELRFTDVTDQARVGHDAYGFGAAVGDYDNDGDADLYVLNLRNNVFFKNNGDGTFTDVTDETSADSEGWSTGASFFDYDRDGDLDLFVVNYVVYNLGIEHECTNSSGNRDYCGPQNYQSAQDHLFRNNGDGTFTDVSAEFGVAAARGAGLGVTAADFDDDGWIDIFVANDGEANHLWFNREGSRFDEMGLMSGTALNSVGSAEASMGVTAGDYDGDGDPDLFMTHLINETNTLYRNDGGGVFNDVSTASGLGFASRGLTGFGTAWFDYDNDGWLDVYIANGAVKIDEFREGTSHYPFDERNLLFHNVGGRFVEIKEKAGAATSLSDISRGLAFGDIDNDGDTDCVVTNNSGPVRLLLNQVGDRNRWVRLLLTGADSNRDAYGARIAVMRSDGPTIWRHLHTDGSYASAGDHRVLIGLGDDPTIESVGVIWPSGRREQWSDVAIDADTTLIEGSGIEWPKSSEKDTSMSP